MKVLMFGWEFPPHNSGGLGVACKGIVDSLCAQGTAVSFVLPKQVPLDPSSKNVIFADNAKALLDAKGVDVMLMPYMTSEGYQDNLNKLEDLRDHKKNKKKNRKNTSQYSRTLIEEVSRYGELAEDIAEAEDHDVIHAHDWLSFEAGISAKKKSGKPFIAHVHATEFDRSGSGINQSVYDIEKKGVHMADQVVAVSHFTKEILIDHYNVPEKKIAVVHNGIDEDQYRKAPEVSPAAMVSRLKNQGYKIVLFVGRITFQKGPDYFVKMAERVRAHEPNAFFVVSGSGDMEKQMIREVAAARMSDRFIFTGFIRGEALDTVYRAADIYIMPSVSEPFGLTPLEAMIQNTPVLISKQTGVSEVVDHALKVNFWDVDDMACKVISVLKNPSLQQCLRTNGKSEVSQVNWQKAAEKLALLYKQLAK
ncbi:MAG: glycosyltransferase family 4 protein [Candidatus Paceibacterota bacterium]